ncbi:PREDICTED: E3 ubiquitin-protein ligase At4g11680-like isoform X3 [Tarenaya hassleriana]|uniref:E3 ubiquitin-protein ligase At4g11680-like isoform X3 n=1 Tax=Tarenaya hassleriana TaxID=28532 RepID=UPI00053C7607|nr:PREDICTED: E3 ubiquitin-protein ligase At4g11680-like isoform X3 [Tarenaya hassleriana]
MSETTMMTAEADSAESLPSSRVGSTASDGVIDTTPFLLSGESRSENADENSGDSRRSSRRQGLREAARFLRHAGSRRMMREPSMLVRETAAEQLEERQSDWAYSKPVVVLDIVWNVAFVAVAVAALVLSRNERPNMPLRVWVVGYALQCLLHMACVCVEYRRRRRSGRGTPHRSSSSSSYSSLDDGNQGLTNSSQQYVSLAQLEEGGNTSSAKHLESANTMFSFVWWIIGFYWVSAGGQTLAHDSPQLYWLCIIFLGFDVFFVVFCVALAFVIGLAVCCCLPCIIAILYAVADQQEGASKDDIEQLPKFIFRSIGDDEKSSGDAQRSTARGIMTENGTDSPIEHALSAEDAECCICLCDYEDGVELRELPCGHHFHCACIDKWLHINSHCPLCKFNILKNTNDV